MLCGAVSAYADNPVFTPVYLDFSGISAILTTCTREEVMYRCTHVIKLHFFWPRGLNQSIGTLHGERVSIIWSWYPYRILKQCLLEVVLIFRRFAGSLLFSHNYSSLIYYFCLALAVRSWHPTWVLRQHLREERRVLQVEGFLVPFLSLIIKRGWDYLLGFIGRVCVGRHVSVVQREAI